MIENNSAIVLSLSLYMAVCLLLGFIAYRRTATLGDFILGGRGLGSWVTAMSAQASDMSGWLLMGLPGLAYLSGFDAVWLLLGLVVGTWANWRYIAARLRARTEQLSDSLTLPDYFERRFKDESRMLRTLSALFILVFFAFYTSSGFVAAGKLFEALFGMPYVEAMFWGSIVMLAYTFFGGFLAVSWSDMLQGTLMFLALVLVAAMGIHLAGGAVPALDALEARDPLLLDPFVADGRQALGWIGVLSLVGWGLGYAGQPHILARFMAIRRVEELATSRRVAMGWVITVLAAAVIVGLTGVLVLEKPLVGADSEKVFILMSTTFFHPVIAGVCLAGIMAAIMSTASAQLLVSSSAFAEDFYCGLFRPQAARGELLWVGRAAVLAIAVIAFLLGLDPDSKVLSLVSWAWAGFGAAFGPAIILSLYWERMTRNGALAGILVGGLTVIIWPRLEGPLFELYELVPGFALSWLVIWIVSIASPQGNSPAR
ncbi:MAG TPA: sodium/proline symporter PutP [Steroidobacteraceae bacterium]|nr:sodium/proline symporter PutP [Steroidobacteraceae bacterium]